MRSASAGSPGGPAAIPQLDGGRNGAASRMAAAAVSLLEAEQQRWFLWLPVFFGLGIAAYFALPGEPPLAAALAPLPAALILARVWRSGLLATLVLGALITASAGLAVAKIRTEIQRAPVLERQFRNVDIRGWVMLNEPKPNGSQRLTLRVISLGALQPAATPARVRVTTRRADHTLQPGDAVRLRATLGPPGAPVEPGGYDFARYAWFHKLGGVGFSNRRPVRTSPAGAPPWQVAVSAAVQKVRQKIGRRITAALPGQTGAIANALITGERGAISDATNDAFRDSGIFHILSISGLHMVIMAGAIFYGLRLVLAAFPGIALRYPVKKWGALGAALGALGYLAISGGSFATVRSYIMISIMFFAILLDRPAVALRNVALAALVILVLFPESLFDIGFQMSFAAVVALVAAYEAMRLRAVEKGAGLPKGQVMRLAVFFGGIVLTTLIASAAVAPFAAYHFHKSQQYAVLANLIAVPICNIIVMPAALATFLAMPFGLEALPLWLMGKGIEGMVWCANAVARLPGAVGLLPEIPGAAFAAMVAGGLWLALWRLRWRLLGLIAIGAGLLLAPTLRRPDILIGRDGRLVAARMDGGSLSALPMRGGRYELSRWLESDGDGRKPSEVAQGRGFACDAAGCTARIAGRLIALPRGASALRDDCRLADLVIVPFPAPRWCRQLARAGGVAGTNSAGSRVPKPGNGKGRQIQADGKGTANAQPASAARLVIDLNDLRAKGNHAIWIEGDRFTIDTVRAHRGVRPWAPARGR